ncbi:MAG TPA: tetratricopeptide repeat protein, partial [Pirellulales bacterium]|nr:tetratricopeptide repeat protein [Pirellulales bacterium]
MKAELLVARERYTAALDALAIADTNPDTRLRALVLAGEALYRSGRFLEAGGAWMQVLEADPQNVDAYRWLGVAYFELGTVKEAVHYLETAAQLAPSDPRPHRVIGLIWRKLDEFATAAEAYRESLRRSPDGYQADDARYELAEVLNHLHRDSEALAVLRQCHPTADVLSLRAACLYGLGQTVEAAQLLDRDIKENPDHLKALLVRAKIALDRAEPQLADGLLQR